MEDVLVTHPGVAEIAIAGLASAKTGELACAFVVPQAGCSPDVADFAKYLAERGVAKFKFPERVELMSQLPRNATGKVLKHVLQQQFNDRADQPA